MNLTEKQEYLAMFYYLERLYDETNSDELGGLLGSMILLEDGRPSDPAVWSDWEEAIVKAKAKTEG